MTPQRRRRSLGHEHQILLLALAGGLPALTVAIVMIWASRAPAGAHVMASLALVLCWLGFAFAVRRRVVFPLQTLANLLACLREGDASLRARGARSGDALGEAMIEANSLASMIREQRLDAREATVLLRRVMAEIDVAVFAFDARHRVKLVNRAGERLVGRSAEGLLDEEATSLGLGACLDDGTQRLTPVTLPGHPGRWEVRRSGCRLGGLPHTLLVLTDVSQSLRDEERRGRGDRC